MVSAGQCFSSTVIEVRASLDSFILFLLLIWYGVIIRSAGAVLHLQLLFISSRGMALSRSTVIFFPQQCVVSDMTLFGRLNSFNVDGAGDSGSGGYSTRVPVCPDFPDPDRPEFINFVSPDFLDFLSPDFLDFLQDGKQPGFLDYVRNFSVQLFQPSSVAFFLTIVVGDAVLWPVFLPASSSFPSFLTAGAPGSLVCIIFDFLFEDLSKP